MEHSKNIDINHLNFLLTNNSFTNLSLINIRQKISEDLPHSSKNLPIKVKKQQNRRLKNRLN